MDQYDLDDMPTDELLNALRNMPREELAMLATKLTGDQRQRLSDCVDTLIRENNREIDVTRLNMAKLQQAQKLLIEAAQRAAEKGRT